jgi:predicted Fe-Mo cluster-binding NifX family protein
MTARIIIPTKDENKLKAHIAPNFSKAPYFTIIDIESGKIAKIDAQANMEKNSEKGQLHKQLLSLKPNALIVKDMAAEEIESFKNAGILVLKSDLNQVKDVLDAFVRGKLNEVTGCGGPVA